MPFYKIYKDKKIAVLGSGPTLRHFEGKEDIAIAVNGAAEHKKKYDYFLCGDIHSPEKKWFYESSRYKAKRIIASFIAPHDKILYPDPLIQEKLLKDRSPFVSLAKEKNSFNPLYEYHPSIKPQESHEWFQYSTESFPHSASSFNRNLSQNRFLHGATIAGVALQLAWWMGASEIYCYGCTFDNETGGNYLYPESSDGKTTSLQRTNFYNIFDIIRETGTKIFTEGT